MTFYQSLDTLIYRAGISGFPYIPRDSYCYDQCPFLAYGEIPYQNPSLCMMFFKRALVSNVPLLADVRDPELYHVTDLTFTGENIWVATMGNGQIIGYDLGGNPLLISFNVLGPGNSVGLCSGICVNFNSSSFLISNGPTVLPCHLLVCTLNGTVNGINRDIDPFNAPIIIDDSDKNAIYTSILTIDFNNGSIMYLVDFNNSKIISLDGNFDVIPDYDFVDEDMSNPMPEQFSPYKISLVNEFLYVCYVLRNPNSAYPQCGSGYVSIFDFSGNFIKRFASRCNLDAPVACLLAPSVFRYPSGTILVANHGNGTISVFSYEGKCLGTLDSASNNPILIPGINTLTTNPVDSNILYWVARDAATSTSSPSIIGIIDSRRDI